MLFRLNRKPVTLNRISAFRFRHASNQGVWVLRQLLAAFIAIALVSSAGAQTSIQSAFPTVFPQPVLILDPDQLLRESDLGEALLAELDVKRQGRIDENQSISSDLEAEEARLTELRPTLEPAEFQTLADAFDEKVQNIREEQIAKDVALQREADQIPLRFIEIAAPILNQLLQKYQAGAIIDRRATLLYNKELDVTDEAIALINQTYKENPDILTEEKQ